VLDVELGRGLPGVQLGRHSLGGASSRDLFHNPHVVFEGVDEVVNVKHFLEATAVEGEREAVKLPRHTRYLRESIFRRMVLLRIL
jgi:hypothetical protein